MTKSEQKALGRELLTLAKEAERFTQENLHVREGEHPTDHAGHKYGHAGPWRHYHREAAVSWWTIRERAAELRDRAAEAGVIDLAFNAATRKQPSDNEQIHRTIDGLRRVAALLAAR